jgi:NAD(P)-dependent dehydrogenase (short-subunit alcohol dehydrogenase family)
LPLQPLAFGDAVGESRANFLTFEGAAMASGKKTAVITGAAGGIGRAIARRFVEDGFQVVAGDADAAGLAELSGALDDGTQRVWEKAGDLRSKAYCEALIDHAVAQTGRLDVLVNNAGIITRGNIRSRASTSISSPTSGRGTPIRTCRACTRMSTW